MTAAHRVVSVLALVGILCGPAPAAQAQDLTLGVFLPQASFSTNAQRSAYGEALAKELSGALKADVRARTFARHADISSFMKANRIDLLVTDSLLMSERKGEILAHAVGGARVVLYARPGTDLMALKGKTVAYAAASQRDADYYANAVLMGEVAPARFFGTLRRAKDAVAALDAVTANAAAAAFAPEGHRAAANLEAVVTGDLVPVAVMVAASPKLSPEQRKTITAKLTAGAGQGGGITGWRAGSSQSVANALSAARRSPRVVRSPAVLADPSARPLTPPPIRLEASGTLPPPEVGPSVVVHPTLPES